MENLDNIREGGSNDVCFEVKSFVIKLLALLEKLRTKGYFCIEYCQFLKSFFF